MLSRRNFLTGSAVALAGAAAVSGRAALAAIPEAPTNASSAMQPPLPPANGQAYQPVVTLNGWTLPFRMNGEWKEFHLVAEEVTREIAPGMTAKLWGYNGQSPGPTIEAVEGDKVRIFVTNKLPEHTTVHWHGMLLPNGMDGVGGLTQPHIPVGKTFVYEFELTRSGTLMYHPHSDEMVQMAMGMMGTFVVHPKDPAFRRVDRDFAFIIGSYRFDPGTALPQVIGHLLSQALSENTTVPWCFQTEPGFRAGTNRCQRRLIPLDADRQVPSSCGSGRTCSVWCGHRASLPEHGRPGKGRKSGRRSSPETASTCREPPGRGPTRRRRQAPSSHFTASRSPLRGCGTAVSGSAQHAFAWCRRNTKRGRW